MAIAFGVEGVGRGSRRWRGAFGELALGVLARRGIDGSGHADSKGQGGDKGKGAAHGVSLGFDQVNSHRCSPEASVAAETWPAPQPTGADRRGRRRLLWLRRLVFCLVIGDAPRKLVLSHFYDQLEDNAPQRRWGGAIGG
jgi:hypothetical protein